MRRRDTGKKFPVEALPPGIRQFAEEAARALPAPIEAIAVPALVAAASAIGTTRQIRIKKGWTELPSLYAAVVMPSGSKKTPAQKYALGPVREKQVKYIRMCRKAWVKYKQREGNAKLEKPVVHRTFTSDTTTEGLAALLEKNPRGLLVVRDELSGLVKSFNQYKGGRGADKQFYLSCYSSVPLTYDRKNQPPLHVEKPFLCVIGGIPPDVLPQLSVDGVEDGFLPRFLYTWPDEVPDRLTADDISEAAHRAYAGLFSTLYSLTPEDNGNPVTLPLSLRAWAHFIKFHDQLSAESEDPNLPQGLRPYYGKLKGCSHAWHSTMLCA